MPDMDWHEAKMVTAGVDIGSVGSKAVVMLDGKLYAYSLMRTGGVSEETAIRVMNWALEETGLKTKNVHCIIGTGYGRVNVPFAKRTITEIACHARGAHYIYGPTVRTVLDIGGQDCKAMSSNFLKHPVTGLLATTLNIKTSPYIQYVFVLKKDQSRLWRD